MTTPDTEPALRPYCPSNGTELMMFDEDFCSRCVHDAASRDHMFLWDTNPTLAQAIVDAGKEPEPCAILGAALFNGLGDPGYPRDTWVVMPGIGPTCLAFRERGDDGPADPAPPEPDPNQLDLFLELEVLV